MRKGEKLISKIYDKIEEKQILENKIDLNNKELDTVWTRAFTAVQVIKGLSDEIFDELINE